jgi:hypothetical protein
VFLDSWRAWGGPASWGNPLTAEIQENGRIVQYYDYGRFEYHPDDPNGVVVHFGDLGGSCSRSFYAERRAAAAPR